MNEAGALEVELTNFIVYGRNCMAFIIGMTQPYSPYLFTSVFPNFPSNWINERSA